MTKAELIREIKAAKAVYGWVKITDDDGSYVKMVKRNLLDIIAEMDDVTFNVSMNHHSLFID